MSSDTKKRVKSDFPKQFASEQHLGYVGWNVNAAFGDALSTTQDMEGLKADTENVRRAKAAANNNPQPMDLSANELGAFQ